MERYIRFLKGAGVYSLPLFLYGDISVYNTSDGAV